MGKKIGLIVLAVAALLSCENPIQAGLGSKVDITAPTIKMLNPQTIGDRVKGTFELDIDAQDDIGIATVLVAVTEDAEGKPIPESSWVWLPAAKVPGSKPEHWTYAIDTTGYPDGDLPVTIKARDSSGKEATFAGMYSSKNNPPRVELQIPALIEDPTPDRHMELVAGGYMVGIAEDLWGVAPGYPKIQFWFAPNGEQNPSNPNEWQDMDSYASMSAADWAAYTTPDRTALEFRYNAVDRSNPLLSLKDMPGLRPGSYHFRLKLKDVDAESAEVIYPPEGYYYVEVVTARELPVITMRPLAADHTTPLAGQYHNEPFYIAADVSHTTGIFEATISVQKEGETEDKAVVLARGEYSDNTSVGTGANITIMRKLETFRIEPGKLYEHTDVETDVPMQYSFVDGAYNFIINTMSIQSSPARQTLTIYIDTTPPEINITRVQPAVEAFSPADGSPDEFTVNGFIAADMSSYDANNIGTVAPDPALPETLYREIKYLLLDTHNPNADAKALYDSAAAQFFDKPVAPVYTRPGSSASLVIDTTHNTITPSGSAYYARKDKYLHFIAKDKAGNYSFTTALLKVDQSTDLPKIDILGFDPSQRSEALLGASAAPNRLDTDRIFAGTFTDDDSVLVGSTPMENMHFKIHQDGATYVWDIPVASGNLTPPTNNRTVNFRLPLPPPPDPGDPSDPDHLADGTYWVEIDIKDSLAAKNELKPLASMANLPQETVSSNDAQGRGIYFVLDTEPPAITETKVGNTDNNEPRLIARLFDLGGTVSDTNGLRSLSIVQLEEGVSGFVEIFSATYTAADKKKDWSVAGLPWGTNKAPNLRSGVFTYEITAVDVANKPAKLIRTVRVDLEAPALTVALPVPLSWVDGPYAVVQGTETDNYRAGPVFYAIVAAPSMGAAASDVFAGKTAPADYRGAVGWKELSVNGTDWRDTPFLLSADGGIGEGIFWLYVTAFDAAGNQATNSGSVPTFGVDQAAPNLGAVKLVNGANADITGTHVKDRFSLKGLVTDANGLAGVTLTEQKDGQSAIPLTLSQAAHYPQTAATTGDVSWDLNVPGLPWNAATASASPPSGNYTYTLRIPDKTGRPDRITTKTFSVVYDVTGPVVTIVDPATGADVSGGTVYISGTAPDAYTTDGTTVWYLIDASSASPTPPASSAAAALDANWHETGGTSWSGNADLTFLGGVEGDHWLHIAAFDRLDNRSAVANQRFNIDTSPPKIETWSVSPPVKVVDGANYAGKSYTITFTAFDSNELQSLEIRRNSIVLQEGTHTSTYIDSFGATQTESYTLVVTKTDPTHRAWPVTLTLANQAEGDYSYSIDIVDIKNKPNTLDNNGDAVNAHKNFSVRVDTEGPVLTVAAPSAGFITGASSLNISGSAMDAQTPAGVRVYWAIDDNSSKVEPNKPDDAGILPGWTQAAGSITWGGNSVPIPSSGVEGERYAHFVAYDKLGNQSNQVDVKFFVDFNNPQIQNWSSSQVTGANALNILKQDNYVFSFTAYDSNALQSVRITREGTELIEAGISGDYTLARTVADDQHWNYALSFTGQSDGNYDFVVEIKDIADKVNVLTNDTSPISDDYKNFSVRVDTVGPVVDISQPTAGSPVNSNSLSISGTATDALTTDDMEVYYLIDANATVATPPASPPGSPWTKAQGGSAWFHSANLTGLSLEGDYYVHVIGFDKLGNPSAQVADRHFIRDMGPPHIDAWSVSPLNSLVPNDAYYYYARNGAFTISFIAKDSNQLQSVEIKRNSVLLIEGSQAGYTLTIDRSDSANKSWPVTLVLTGEPEGDYAYALIVKDILDQENTADNSTDSDPTDDHKTFTVRVDTTKPTLTVAHPADGSNISTNSMQVSGTATDTTTDDLTVWYLVDHNATVGAPPVMQDATTLDPSGWTMASGGLYWYEVGVSLPGEGTYYAHFFVFDKLGNRSDPTDRTIYVDYNLPQINAWTSTDITEKQPAVNLNKSGSFGFSFDAYDTNGVKDVKIYRDGTEAPSGITIGGADGDLSRTVTVALSGEAEGEHIYIVEVEDMAGRKNPADNTTETVDGSAANAFKTFTVRVDQTGPELTVNNPGNGAEVSGSSINVNGTATDLTTDGLSVWHKVDGSSTATAPATKAAAAGAGWTEAPGGTNWSKSGIDLTTVGEGTRYVHFVGFDKLDNASAVTTRTIYYDLNLPYMEGWTGTNVVVISGSYYAKGAYTLGFAAKDSNALASVAVSRNGTALSEGTHPEYGGYTLTVNRTDATNKSWPVTLALANPDNGNAAYEFVIKDVRNKENTLENLPNTVEADQHKKITVRVDKQGPIISVTNPVPGYAITGTTFASDGYATDSGIPEGIAVYYTITNDTAVTEPATKALAAGNAAWTEATPDSSWNIAAITLGAGVNGEGRKRIYFAAYDQLDNSSLIYREFYVDLNVPHIETWTSSDITSPGSTLLAKNNVGFTFVARDTNALRSVKVSRGSTVLVDAEATSDGSGGYTYTGTGTGTGTGYTYTVTPAADNKEWTVVVGLTSQADNNYVYSIDITDIAGKVNIDGNAPGSSSLNYKTFNVRIDTLGPVLAFTSPADGSTVGGSVVTIGGTAVDALTPAGVTVWYVIDGNSAIGSPASPPAGAPPVLAGWTQAEGSADWYKNAAISSPTEGLLYIHAVAYDALGNRSNIIAHKPFYVDVSPPIIDGFSFTNVTLDAGVNFAGQAYSFAFTARDSNALQSVKISRGSDVLVNAAATSDGSGGYTYAGTGTGSGTGYSYTVTPNGANTEWVVGVSFTGQADGNYAFTIEVKDITGKENTTDNSTPALADDDYKTFGVRVDTTGPVLTVVDPAANMNASGAKLYIGGTAPDALTNDNITVYYLINDVSNTSAPANMAAAIANWNLAPGGAFWSDNADLVSGAEGNRYLHVIAYDKLGNASGTTPVHRTFFVDVNLPQILAWGTAPATGVNFSSTPYYAGKDYTLRFDAFDSNTLAGGNTALSQSLVEITRNGDVLQEGTHTDSGATYTLTVDRTDSKTWPVTLVLTNQADGNYSYSIEIRDATGKENALDNSTTADLTDDRKTFAIMVDNTPPNTSLTMAPATVSNAGMDFVIADPTKARSDNVNGVIEFVAAAMDPSGLDGVKWFIIPYSGKAAFETAISTTAGLKAVYASYLAYPGTLFTDNTYSVLRDTTTALGDQTVYSLYILAQDKAGNVGHNNTTPFTFYVDQRTDVPLLALTNLSKTNPADPDPVVRDAFTLQGTVKDDDGVDTASIKINLYNGTNWYNGSDWTATSAVDLSPTTITGTSRDISFSYTLPAMGDGAGKRVIVKAADLLSSKAGSGNTAYDTANAVKTSSVGTYFTLDTAQPVITITNMENTYKTSQAITGTVTEANLRVFRVSLDGALVYDAFDAAGNPKLTGELLLTGSGETKTWTLTIPTAAFNALDDGPRSLLWTAEDAVGNLGSLGRSFYKDSSGPDINFTNINEDQMFIIRGQDAASASIWYNPRVMNDASIITKDENALKAVADVITDGTPRLTGTFSDEYSTVFASTAAADIKFWYRFDVNGASNIDAISGHPWIEATGLTYLPNYAELQIAAAKTVRWQIPLSSLAQGYHTVDIKVFDRWGSENGLTVKASANDPAAGKYYQYERVAFRLDSDPPVIVVPAVTDGDKALVNGATFGTHNPGQLMFTLKANVSDVTLSEVTAKIYVGSSTTPRYAFSLGSIVDGAVKTLTINKPFYKEDMDALLAAAYAASETSNIFRVEITAVDGAPRQTIETLQFKMDGAPPTITTGNLITNTSSASYPTVIIDALPTIQGNISDDSGIGEATYTIERWNYGTSAWQTVASAQNLSATNFASNFVTMEAFVINLTTAPLNLTDGRYRISFDLKDKASPNPNQATKINGTVDNINNIVFFIDRAAPAMDTVIFKSPPFYSGTEIVESSIDYMAVYLAASDLNTITQIRARLETDTPGTYPLAAAAYTSVAGADYRLLIPKTMYAEGLHTLTLEARDGAGRITTITRDFTLDKTMPMLQIIEPVPVAPEPLAEITSEATIRGITVDNTSVSKLYYLFGRTEVSGGTVASAGPAGTTVVIDGKIWREFSAGVNQAGATIASSSYTPVTATSNLDKAQGGGSLYNWTIRLPNSVDLTTGVNSGNPNGTYVSLHSGSTFLCDLPIRFMMIDSAGNVAIHDYTVVVNPKGDEPTVAIASPSPSNTAAQNEVGGVITVVGAAKDNDWIHRVVFRVIDGNEPDTGSPKTLPVYNALAGDGYAADAVTNTNYAAAPYSDSRGGWHQAPIVGAPGSNVQWSINLNNNGGLNAPAGGTRVVTIQVLAYDTPAANHAIAQTMGELTTVKVTFVDGLPFVVDGSVIITPDPKNGVPFDYDDPVANKRVGEVINIKARVRDDNGLKELSWHGEDTTQFGSSILSMNPGVVAEYAKPLNAVQSSSINVGIYYMWLEGGARTNVPFLGSTPPAGLTWAAPALNHNGTAYTDNTLAAKAYIDYELSLTLDTRALANKAGPLLNRAGTWTLSILATDHTDFKMPANWSLQIDNYFPLGTYTGNGVAAGASYQLQGLAWDTGTGVTVQGIKKVVAWFSRGPNFVPLNERDIGSGAMFKAAAGSITVAHGRTDANKDNTPSGATGNWNTGVINDGISPIKFPDLTYTRKYLANGTTPNPDYYRTNSANEKFISGIEIDRNEPTSDNDEDGFLEGLADAGNNFQWYARIDTTKFLDGLLTVHYLVYDHAGNASYYSNNIFVSNNPPKVTSVDIGTDVLGVSSTADPRGHRMVSANYGNTNITARNRQLSFTFSMQGDLGAKPFHYRFGYVNSRTPTSANALIVGEIYAITATGTVSWEAVGAPSGYGVGTTFMATDTTSFGTGSADRLTISNIKANNINSASITDHVVSYNYTVGDFGSGSNQIPDATGNNAWFVLRVYNSLKIPMKPDVGALEDGGMSQTGAGGFNVYVNGSDFEVWDQPFDVVRIGVNVASDDVVKPEVKLWDFNPGGETAGISGATGTAAQPPSSIDLTPNAAKSPNLLKGGLYNPRNNNRIIERSGHIEPRYAASAGNGSFFIDGNYGSASFAKDTLSGEVILRGFAYDEQRLGAVYIRIDSPSATGTEFKILQSDDSSAYNPSNPGNRGLLVPVSGQNAFVHNQIGIEGHMAEWAYVWNTVNLPASFVAGDNVKVQVRVEDKRASPNVSAIRLHPNVGETANGTTIVTGTNDGRYPLVLRNADGWRLDKASVMGYNRIAVTLAPYLNSFQRDASKGYSSLRSRQGWYSFSRGETIVAQGWNLKYPSGNTTVTFNTATATVAATVTTQTPTGITFTTPATAISGDVILVANGVSTVNDRNDNRNPWNRDDYNLSLSGNELWIDDRAAHVWASDAGTGTNVVEGSDRMQINASETPTDPAMTMAPLTGALWASWSNTANAAVYMNTNQGAAARVELIRNSGGGGQLTTTDLYFSQPQRSGTGNNVTHPTVFYHSNRIYGNTYSQTQSGGLKGYDPQGGARFDTSSTGEAHQYNVELTYHNQLNTQFEGYHRVVYRGDNMHVSYFDSKDKSLKYWYAKSGWTISSGNYNSNTWITSNGWSAESRHWMNLDGGSDAQDTSGGTYWNRVRTGGSATEGTWNFNRASMAGPWSAIDLQSSGNPVIAYFDQEHSTLRLAYADAAANAQSTGNPAGTVAGNWKVKYAMDSSDLNYGFAGEYVSMQIDQTNNDAHLAFFRSNSTQLIYLKLRWTGTTYEPYGPSVIVDESSANGKWVDLTLDRQNRPWISYQDISRAGNFDGVKMAYYDPTKYETAGTPSYDMNGIEKTGWETMNVPAIYKASDNRTSIEVWPHRDTPTSVSITKTWAAAVGYTNPDYYRIAYYLKPRN